MTVTTPTIPLAHSAAVSGENADPYVRHVAAVRTGTCARAETMLRFAIQPPKGFIDTLDLAATFHDLGKLDPENQVALRKGKGHRLKWDHIDAGVAHLMATGSRMAAWLVRAHHAPGLPQKSEHFDRDSVGRKLRGCRHDDAQREKHDAQITRTDTHLSDYLALHESAIPHSPTPVKHGTHGLAMRLALSCLVDADHTDTALFDSGKVPLEPPAARWDKRLESLCQYVQRLAAGETSAKKERNERRRQFFDACLTSPISDAMVACEGSVGIGKTTAVAAYLIRRARDEGLRRLIIVAPYTNILTQTAKRLRAALVLPGEDADKVIVEHHHRAEFENREERDFAALWQAPIVLTTAVSFFETLSACRPASLRNLHAVPGSAIFLDEAHAAMPVRLWPQNFQWLRELAENWSCRFVFASGSLVRFWEDATGIDPNPLTLPELLPHTQAAEVFDAEKRRVKYVRLAEGRVVSVEELIEFVDQSPGPRLVILSTVQNAAIVADAMRKAGHHVLHISTALTPAHRDLIVSRLENRLVFADFDDWTLVATSCVEAGVDLSFRTGFRERFAVASTIQTSGRVNRHGEHDALGGGVVYDFALDGPRVTKHPEATTSADVLRELLIANKLNDQRPSDVVTLALREELSRRGGLKNDLLLKAESERNYPEVAKLGRVIESDTRLVVVDPEIQLRLKSHDGVSFHELIQGSVQLWSNRVEKLALEPVWPGADIFLWKDAYDPDFLGFMAGVLRNAAVTSDNDAWII